MVDDHLRASHIMFDLLAAHHINTLLYLIILYRRRQHFLQQRVQPYPSVLSLKVTRMVVLVI